MWLYEDDETEHSESDTSKRIDFVLAAKNDDVKEHEMRRENYFYNLRTCFKLEINGPRISRCGHEQFWHIYAPFDSLCEVAEDLKFRLPTKEHNFEIETWFSKIQTKFFNLLHKYDPFIIKDSLFKPSKSYFTDIFDKNRIEEFVHCNNPGKLFNQTTRSGLVAYMLECTPFESSFSRRRSRKNHEILGKTQLKNAGVFTAGYPSHDGPIMDDSLVGVCSIITERQKLYQEWANFRHIFKYQPIDAIKNYFGEKTGFYFAWVGFYTTYLVLPSILGIICILYGAISIPWHDPVQEICSPKNESLYYMCPLCDRMCSYHSLQSTCVYAKASHLFDNKLTLVFAFFMTLWSIVFIKFWNREQSRLAYNWHMLDFKEEQSARPQYTASARSFKSNPVTGIEEPYRSKKERCCHFLGTLSVILFFMALVISTLIGVIIYRAAIFAVLLTTNDDLRQNSKIFVTCTAATINLIVINILKLIYEKLALMITNWENPRTRTAFEHSFALKMFWFSFCNTYASVFYVAFFKSEMFVGWPGHHKRFGELEFRLEGCSSQGCFLELCIQIVVLMVGQQFFSCCTEHVIPFSSNTNWPGHHKRFGELEFRLEGCSAQGCFLELCIQIIVLMVGQQFFSCCTEVFIPYLKRRYYDWKNAIRLSTDVPVWEGDFGLQDMDNLSIFWFYQKVALQFGFVTMFVAAFPLAPFVALFTNLFEIRIEAINMIKNHRRSVAYRADGIGVFREIMLSLMGFGILVNAFVLAFSSDFIPQLLYQYEYSVDGTLKGYVNWTLSTYNISDFKDIERPENPTQHIELQLPYCRFPGFHKAVSPYDYNGIHWKIMTYRLVFVFLFYFTGHTVIRIVQLCIRQQPQDVYYKIKRQEYLAKQALRRYKMKYKLIPCGEEEKSRAKPGDICYENDDTYDVTHVQNKENRSLKNRSMKTSKTEKVLSINPVKNTKPQERYETLLFQNNNELFDEEQESNVLNESVTFMTVTRDHKKSILDQNKPNQNTDDCRKHDKSRDYLYQML